MTTLLCHSDEPLSPLYTHFAQLKSVTSMTPFRYIDSKPKRHVDAEHAIYNKHFNICFCVLSVRVGRGSKGDAHSHMFPSRNGCFYSMYRALPVWYSGIVVKKRPFPTRILPNGLVYRVSVNTQLTLTQFDERVHILLFSKL